MIDFTIDRIQGVTPPKTAWAKNYAKMEWAHVGMLQVGERIIWVKDLQACMTCGKEFLASNNWYCSDRCAGQWEHDDELS